MARRRAAVAETPPEMVQATFIANYDHKCVCADCNCPSVTAYKAGWSGMIPKAAYDAALAKGRIDASID